MPGVIARMSLSIDSEKVGESETGTYSKNNNGEQQHGDDGIIGISDGNTECEYRCSVIVTTRTSNGYKKLTDAIKNKKYIDVHITNEFGVDDYWKGKVMSQEYSGDSRNGTLKGSFTIRNGEDPLSLGED